jgi:hypothetical protein
VKVEVAVEHSISSPRGPSAVTPSEEGGIIRGAVVSALAGRYRRRRIVGEQRRLTVSVRVPNLPAHVARGLRLGWMERSRGGDRGSMAG